MKARVAPSSCRRWASGSRSATGTLPTRMVPGGLRGSVTGEDAQPGDQAGNGRGGDGRFIAAGRERGQPAEREEIRRRIARQALVEDDAGGEGRRAGLS